jgi:tetratricopeptide (TPR) repeat protein
VQFFDRFRTALARYEEGVHLLGEPATEAALANAEARLGARLPEALRDFLRQWNGGFLFHDEIALHGVAGARSELDHLARQPAGLALGTTPSARLFLDERGRVLAIDEETEARRVEGSSLDGWLAATMAREGLLFDRDGEYKDEVFDGEGLSEKTQRKRAQLGSKADPAAPAWHEELAAIFDDGGEPESALEELECAVAGTVEGDAGLADAWLAIGGLRHRLGRPDEASAFVQAARALPDAGEAAWAWAQAARAEAARDADVARGYAAEVTRLAPGFVAEQREAARHLEEEGDLDGAVERLELALAVTPDDAEARGRLGHVRARRKLRPT